jgi:sec-independent protein translocase protein TatB
MFDLGWTEMLVIGIVALIVIGPKDLPVMFRTLGQFIGKAKGMAREFSRAMNDAADDAGVKDMAKGLQAATNPVSSAMDGVKSAAADLTKFDPESETGKLAAQKAAETAERAENAKKFQAATARATADRKLKEAQAAQAKAEELEAKVAPSEKSDT